MERIIKFGEALAKFRLARKLSKSKLAEMCGADPGSIRKWEEGENHISWDKLMNLCEVLEVKPNDFLTGTTVEQQSASLSLPYWGEVAAGEPIVSNPDGQINLNNLWTGGLISIFRVRGSSMRDVGIRDADYVVVRKLPTAEPGDTVVAWVGDEESGGLTLKILAGKATEWRLLPKGSSGQKSIPVDDKAQIVGVYLGLIRKA